MHCLLLWQGRLCYKMVITSSYGIYRLQMQAKGAKSAVESAVSVTNVARDEGRIVNSSGYGIKARTFLGRARKKMEERIGSVEERVLTVKGDVESMKEELQRLGSLEQSVEALMEKLSILDRLDHELLGKGDWRSSAKDPNDHNRPVPDSGDLDKSIA
ncbi:hypothetical protein TIFTF001_023053 [Ficus carica]|uniref:Uncharacterized protein n=1 Tax=Ficus carica TaxID=3494 RepID=A0AA88AL55_FICCA|nr:hypothetical protein TIFTF001_023053 [Ficus carica]